MSDQPPSIAFRLETRSDRAPFRQLVDQVVSAVERGQLQVGDQLPSVRVVVGQITINPNTVHRAYRELEHLGLVEGRSGLGTFVYEHVTAGDSLSELRAAGDVARRNRGSRGESMTSHAVVELRDVTKVYRRRTALR